MLAWVEDGWLREAEGARSAGVRAWTESGYIGSGCRHVDGLEVDGVETGHSRNTAVEV